MITFVVFQLHSNYKEQLEKVLQVTEELNSVKRDKESVAQKLSDVEAELIRVELSLQTNHVSHVK